VQCGIWESLEQRIEAAVYSKLTQLRTISAWTTISAGTVHRGRIKPCQCVTTVRPPGGISGAHIDIRGGHDVIMRVV